MASPFWKRNQPNMREKVSPKKPAPEPIKVDDGPVAPCSFMPQRSYSMLAFSPESPSQQRDVSNADIELLTPSSDGSIETSFASEEDRKPNSVDLDVQSMKCTPYSAPTLQNRVNTFDTLAKKGFLLRNTFTHLNRQILDSAVCLYLVGLCVLLVIANHFLRTHDLALLVLSALEIGSKVVDMGLESVGFFFGRAVAKIMHGFMRGYYMG